MTAGQLEVRISLPGGDDALVADQSSMLREELDQLDVDDISDVTSGDAPAGSKGLELVAVGSLLVKLARSAGGLRQVVDAVRDWLSRNDATSVRLEIDGDVLEVTGISNAERQRLIDLWVDRHSVD